MIGSSPRFLSYEPGNTILHRMDPRAKVLCTAAIVAAALVADKPLAVALALATGALAGLMAFPLLPTLVRTLRPLLVLIVLFGALIVVVTPGHAFARFGFIVATTDGVQLAIRLGLQALLIVYTTSLLSLTTPPLAVADALEWVLKPLERLRLPVRDIIAMVGIGLTFVPLLLEEAQKVIAAQRARGADLGFYALLEEESMGALLIPLLLANLRRGSDLADSMEARLYGTGPRTSLIERHFRRLDVEVLSVVLLLLVGVILLSFTPLGL